MRCGAGPPESDLHSASSITPATVNGRIILLLVVDWEVPPVTVCVCVCVCVCVRERERDTESSVYLCVNMHLLHCARVLFFNFLFQRHVCLRVSVSSRVQPMYRTHTHTHTHSCTVGVL